MFIVTGVFWWTINHHFYNQTFYLPLDKCVEVSQSRDPREFEESYVHPGLKLEDEKKEIEIVNNVEI